MREYLRLRHPHQSELSVDLSQFSWGEVKSTNKNEFVFFVLKKLDTKRTPPPAKQGTKEKQLFERLKEEFSLDDAQPHPHEFKHPDEVTKMYHDVEIKQ